LVAEPPRDDPEALAESSSDDEDEQAAGREQAAAPQWSRHYFLLRSKMLFEQVSKVRWAGGGGRPRCCVRAVTPRPCQDDKSSAVVWPLDCYRLRCVPQRELRRWLHRKNLVERYMSTAPSPFMFQARTAAAPVGSASEALTATLGRVQLQLIDTSRLSQLPVMLFFCAPTEAAL
jgi:hypothetical protein